MRKVDVIRLLTSVGIILTLGAEPIRHTPFNINVGGDIPIENSNLPYIKNDVDTHAITGENKLPPSNSDDVIVPGNTTPRENKMDVRETKQNIAQSNRTDVTNPIIDRSK